MSRRSVLVFAGSDPCCGAGIQADILTISAMGAHPLSVVTVLTGQDNDHVYSHQALGADMLRQQVQPLIDKIPVSAIKIGIIGSRANAEVIAETIDLLRLQQPELPVVLDPVLASGHGDVLSSEDPILAILPLLPLTTVITPNLMEAVALCSGDRRADTQADMLMEQGCRHVLIKGGHGTEETVVNRWFSDEDGRSWKWPRLPGSFHGSGCTLAAALAAQLALGKGMMQALEAAQAYAHRTLESAYAIAPGQSIPNRMVKS